MYYEIPLATAFVYESDHHALPNVGQGHVVLEEGGEEEGSARSRVDRAVNNATAIDTEIDPQGRRFSRRQTDLALQSIVECCAAITKRVAVLLRLYSDSGEVHLGLTMSL